MHSFRLYLINAVYILTFPYRFVNIYFCVFSDFFRSCRFFIDKSFKAQKPPAAKRFAETESHHGGQTGRHKVKRRDSKPAFPTPAAYCRPAACLCVAANACPKTVLTPDAPPPCTVRQTATLKKRRN